MCDLLRRLTGYGNTAPASATLQIYDVHEGSFTPTFTPLPRSSTPTLTLPGPSQTSNPGTPSHTETGSHGSVHPTSTFNPNPDDPNNGDGGELPGGEDGSSNSKTTAIAVGTIFGVLGLLAVGSAGAYYIRRRQRQAEGDRQFMALHADDNDEDGESSPHMAGGIPAAGYADDKREFGHGWNLGVLNSLGLAGVIGATTGSRNTRHMQRRRDMLADEDTRDFGEWYDARRRDGTGGSSWSLRSILGTRMRSREPSTGTAGGASWKEKEDPFSDSTALISDEETGYLGASASGRPHGRRQISYTSTRSGRSYVDPFADPIQEERREQVDSEVEEGHPLARPYPRPAQPLPTLRTILPVSMGAHILSPLSERTSQNTLSMNDPSTSASSHSEHPNSPFDVSSSRLTSRTSLEPPHSPTPLTSSIIGANLAPSQPMRRSDTWWSRFSRTSFLDRRTSDTSRRSTGMPDIRDPNPAPRLGPIQESMHSASPDRNSPKSRSDSNEQGKSVSRRTSRVYGTHNKSLTSVRTADTEAIERMAGTMDVAQRVRTGSHRTTGSTSTTGTRSINTHPDSWEPYSGGTGSDAEYELPVFASPVEISHTEFLTPSRAKHSNTSQESSPLDSPITDNDQKHRAGSAVGTRIQAYERRISQDEEIPNPTNTRQWEERTRKKNASVNYGLVQRPSLYVANPDHRTTPSGGS